MTSQQRDDVEPLLRQRNASQDGDYEEVTEPKKILKSYSILKVRVVTSIVITFCGFVGTPSVTLVSQYLVHRLSEAEEFNNTLSNFSVCYSDKHDPRVAQTDALQAKASTQLMYISYATSIPSIVASLVVGAYADFIGRRFTLLFPLLGMTIKLTLVTIIIRLKLDIWVFYIAYAIEGFVGSGYVLLIALFTIQADTSEGKQERVFWIMIISTLGNIFAAVSNITSGYIIENIGFFPAAAVLAAAYLLAFIIPFLFLPETVPEQEVKVLNLFENIKRVFGFFLFEGTIRQKLTFTTLLLMFFFAIIDASVATIDTLYQLHRPFCWEPTLIGYYSALRAGGGYLVGLLLLKALQDCVKDEYIGMAASLFQTGGYTMQAFVTTTWQLFLVPVVGMPGCLIYPVLQGMISVLAGPKKQGAVFTSLAVMQAICNTAASTIFNKIYAATVGDFNGAVYLVMASLSILTFLLFFVYFYVYESSSNKYDKLIQDETMNQKRMLNKDPEAEHDS